MLLQLPGLKEDNAAAATEGGDERLLEALLRDGLLNQSGSEGSKPLTQERLIELTGLARNSVKTYTSTKLRGVLDESGLSLKPDAGYALGVDFARTHRVRVLLTDLRGTWKEDAMLPQADEIGEGREPDASETLARAVSQIWQVMQAEKIEPDQLVGVGIGIATPSVPELSAGNAAFGHWKRWANPGGLLKNALNEKWKAQGNGPEAWSSVDFASDNDTNLSAIVDHLWGGGQGSECSLFIKWQSSVRAALILDGRLYTGSAGFAGELPHVKVENHDARCASKTCPVGAGCLYGIAPLEKIAEIAGTTRVDEIIEAAGENANVREALRTAGKGIGRALAPLAIGINPELIIVGGALGARAYPLVLESIREGVESEARTAEFAVTNSTIRNRGTVRGAAALALLEFGPAYLKRAALAARTNGNGSGGGRGRSRAARRRTTATR